MMRGDIPYHLAESSAREAAMGGSRRGRAAIARGTYFSQRPIGQPQPE
jgi:hypothetical protein